VANAAPSFRHQVFELPKLPLEITEYQVFHGHCQHCDALSKGELPNSAPNGQMGPRLLSHIAVLAGKYHLSVRKIQSLLHDQYGMTFSVGAISEAQGRISSMLTPIHQALKQHIQKAPIIHADETTHQRNGESNTRWLWLMASNDAVFQNIRYFRSQDNAKVSIHQDGVDGISSAGMG
jgi:transposase